MNIRRLIAVLSAGMLCAALFLSFSFKTTYETHAEYVTESFGVLTQENGWYVSDELQASFPFHALGFKLDIPMEGMVIQVRTFNESDGWTEWKNQEEDHDINAEYEHYTKLSFTPLSSKFQYRILPSSQEQLEGQVDISYYNALDSEVSMDVGYPIERTIAAVNGGFMTRSDWGADESLMYLSTYEAKRAELCESKPWYCNTDTAAAEANAKKAKELRENFPDDTATESTISYHNGHELLWPSQSSKTVKKLIVHHTAETPKDSDGDGSYTLEDEKANMRATYYYHAITRGWGDIGYNYVIGRTGTVYEGRFGGPKAVGAHALWRNISSVGISVMGNFEEYDVDSNQVVSLVNILTQEANRFGIDPTGSSVFYGETKPNIMGHRDVAATACPGTFLYSKLDTIRSNAKLGSSGNYTYTNVNVNANGSIGNESRETEEFSSGLNVPLNSASPEYTTTYLSGVRSISVLPGETKSMDLRFRNDGTRSWGKNTFLHVGENDSTFIKVVPAEHDNPNKAANFPAEVFKVDPGEEVVFRVYFKAGLKPIERSFHLTPMIDGTRMIQSAVINVRVADSDLGYQYISSSYPQEKFYFGETKTATVTLKNTGNVTWVRDGDGKIVLRADGPRGRQSEFKVTDRGVLGKLKEQKVTPGNTGTFEMQLTAPTEAGRYVEYFTPAIDGYGYLEDRKMSITLSVIDPRSKITLDTSLGSISEIPAMGYNEKYEAFFEVVNNSSETWSGLKGLDVDLVSIKSPGVQVSPVGFFADNTIKPGEAARVNFTIQAPNRVGSMIVKIKPQVNGKAVFKNNEISYSFKVVEPVASARLLSSHPLVTKLTQGEEHVIQFKVENTGNMTWIQENTGIGLFNNRSVLPNNFYHETWHGPLKPAILEEETVAPGDTGTFTFLLKAKDTGFIFQDYKMGIKDYGWVNMFPMEMRYHVFAASAAASTANTSSTTPTTTPTDNNVTTTPTSQLPPTTSDVTTPTSDLRSPTSASQQTVRIRLSVNESTATLQTWNDAYKLYVDGQFKGAFTKSQPPKVEILASKLGVSTPTLNRVEGEIIRVEPVKEGDVIEITDFYRFPAWDTKKEYNDNVFKGNLEFRFNTDNGRLLVINELPLIDYMRGIAEVPASDPFEKRKVLAVLARTYVRFYLMEENTKFPGKPYDGSDDPNEFQKYLGHRFTMRAPYWKEAVESTIDEVVTYNGALVKTPYFNESDGRTRSAQEVWGWTNTPYLKSVDDSVCNGGNGTLRGHGVGLSGCGASEMARQGKSYKDIIKYYYSGVEVEKR